MLKNRDESLFHLSAFELAELIKARKVSAREVVSAHIDRLESVNPKINAVVQPLYDEALKAADAADTLTFSRSKKPLPPLHGVPCSLKGNLAVNGKLWTGGNWYRRHVTADFDATVVKRVIEAGAIPICLTNVPEACMWMETDNRIHGRTNNPHDIRRIVGGSSGGEAAVIAAGAAPFGIGSDIGGSIRMPSFFCGIAGHKPTACTVPSTGQWPEVTGEALKYNCGGPMARSVKDLFPLLQILSGPDGKDPTTVKRSWSNPESISLPRLRVFYYTNNGQVKVSREMRRAVESAAKKMEQLGCIVEEWCPKSFSRSLQIWGSMLTVMGSKPYEDVITGGQKVPLLKEFTALLLGKSKHTFPSLALVLLEKLFQSAPKQLQNFVAEGKRLKVELQNKLGNDGILIAPPYTHPAPRHHIPKFRPINWVYTAIYNVMEMPVTAVPTGKSRDGLPLGVQVAAIPGRDDLTLATAEYLEDPVSPVLL